MLQQALLQGATQIGLNYLTEELKINPLLANIGYATVGALLDATFSPTNDADNRNIMEKVFDTFAENTLTMFGYNPPPQMYDQRYWRQDSATGTSMFDQNLYDSAWGQYYWQEATYIAQTQNFADIMRTQGIEAALNTYALGLFNGIAVSTISNVAGIAIENIGTFIQGEISDFDKGMSQTVESVINDDGSESLIVNVKDDAGKTVSKIKLNRVLNSETGEYEYKMEGYEVGDEFSAYGEWGKDDSGKVAITKGEILAAIAGQEVMQQIEASQNGTLFTKRIVIYDPITGLKTTLNPLGEQDILDLGLEDNPWTSWYMTTEDDSPSYLYPDNRTEMTYIIGENRIYSSSERTDYVMYDNGEPIYNPNKAEIWRYYNEDGDVYRRTIKFDGLEKTISAIEFDDGLGGSATFDLNGEGFIAYCRGSEVFVGTAEDFTSYNFPYNDRVVVPTSIQGVDAMEDMLINQYDISQDDLENSDLLNSLKDTINKIERDGVSKNEMSGTVYLANMETEVDAGDLIPGVNSYSIGTFHAFEFNPDSNNKHQFSTQPDLPGVTTRTSTSLTVNKQEGCTSVKAVNLIHRPTAGSDMNTVEFVNQGIYDIRVGDDLIPQQISFEITAEVDAELDTVKLTFTSALSDGTTGEKAGNFFTFTHTGIGENMDNKSMEYVKDILIDGYSDISYCEVDPGLIMDVLINGGNNDIMNGSVIDFVNNQFGEQ